MVSGKYFNIFFESILLKIYFSVLFESIKQKTLQQIYPKIIDLKESHHLSQLPSPGKPSAV